MNIYHQYKKFNSASKDSNWIRSFEPFVYITSNTWPIHQTALPAERLAVGVQQRRGVPAARHHGGDADHVLVPDARHRPRGRGVPAARVRGAAGGGRAGLLAQRHALGGAPAHRPRLLAAAQEVQAARQHVRGPAGPLQRLRAHRGLLQDGRAAQGQVQVPPRARRRAARAARRQEGLQDAAAVARGALQPAPPAHRIRSVL